MHSRVELWASRPTPVYVGARFSSVLPIVGESAPRRRLPFVLLGRRRWGILSFHRRQLPPFVTTPIQCGDFASFLAQLMYSTLMNNTATSIEEAKLRSAYISDRCEKICSKFAVAKQTIFHCEQGFVQHA